MKKTILISCILFFTIAGRSTCNGSPWWVDYYGVTPASPTTLDVITLSLGGNFPGWCPPLWSAVSVDGYSIYFDAIWDWEGACISIPENPPPSIPWYLEESVGPLPRRGTYSFYAGLCPDTETPAWYDLVTTFVVTSDQPATVTVGPGGSGAGYDFGTIQEAIDAVWDGDTISVYPGTYTEAIDFNGKAITLQSADDPAVIEAPGDYAVSFLTGEGPDSILKNFIITGSDIGIFINSASPTISNVTVAGNGAGIEAWYGADPNISNSIFWNNPAGDLFQCQAQYSFVPEPNLPTAGLVGHWAFDEGTGTDANDSAGSNDGTLVGDPCWVSGKIGSWALDFNGNDVHVRIPDDDSISVGNQDYTISAWINPRSLTGPDGAGTIVSKVKDTADKEYRLSLTDGDLHLDVEKNSNNQFAETNTAPVETGYWQHIAVTFNSSTTTPTFYYNGAVQTSTSNIDTLPDELNDDLYIGMSGGAYYTNEFNGTIDDVRIYDVALTAEEVEQVYGAGAYPLFANANTGDYHLRSGRGRYWPEHDIWVFDDVTSPCVDGGDPAVNPGDEPMPNGGRVNMGAYGGTAYASKGGEWPLEGDLDYNGKVDMTDLAKVAQQWLNTLPWAEN